MKIEEIIRYLKAYQGQITIMEVCGTHTSSIFKNGIRTLISTGIKLVSGPGCPVCVTPRSVIDGLIGYAKGAEVLSFGDMFRVPGSRLSLADAKAQGARIRLMYSPFEALTLAKAQPENQFVLAAVGFETTIPVYAALLDVLIEEEVQNVKLYTALKTIPEALDFVCSNEAINAFLCPGHVSAIIGSKAYEPLCHKYQKPFVITGFEAEHILAAIYEIVRQKKQFAVTNLYPSVVSTNGQEKALELMDQYFVKTDSFWRGIGVIKHSGYRIRDEYARFSANPRLPCHRADDEAEALPNGCRCADVMLGRSSPDECALFGKACTPQHPIGACMVSSEGACGIWRSGG